MRRYLLLFFLPLLAYLTAFSNFTHNGIEYYVNDEGYVNGHKSVTLYKNYSSGDVFIPGEFRIYSSVEYDMYTDYVVRYITDQAFQDCTTVTSVYIPSTVRTIGWDAFAGCTNLKTVTFSAESNLYNIGSYTFDKCTSLCSINLPANVESIGYYTFRGCTSLQEVTMGNALTAIKHHAFSGCTSLSSVTFGNSLNEIEYNAFEECASLSTLTLPASYTKVADAAFFNCTGLKTLDLPYITEIGQYAFRSCTGLTTVKFYDTFTKMGDNAFQDCSSLTSIDFGNSLTCISNQSFIGCSSLSTLNISNSIEQINYQAFDGCSNLTTVNFGNSLRIIGAQAFSNTGVTSLKFPASLTWVRERAFFLCNQLSSIDFGSASAEIDEYAFAHTTALEKTNFGNVTKIGSYAFWDSNLYEVVKIPDTVTEIGEAAFYDCSLLNVVETSPTSSLTKIGAKAFQKSVQLKDITLPPSLKEIGLNAFLNTGVLYVKIYDIGAWCDIDFKSPNPQYSFEDCDSNPLNPTATLFITDGESTQIIRDLVIPPTVTKIKNFAFENCAELTSVTFPETLTEIGALAFYNCPKLAGSLTLPDALTKIGDGAFKSCTLLTGELTIPDKVTSIGSWAFEKDKGFTTLSLGKSVSAIGSSAFSEASKLKTVYNYSNLTLTKNSEDNGYAAYYAVKLYNNLEGRKGDYIYEKYGYGVALKLYLGSESDISLYPSFNGKALQAICDECFMDNTSLQTVKLPYTLVSIGNSAFKGCTNLTSVTIPEGVKTIDIEAFSGCLSLEEVVLPNTLSELGGCAFYGASGLLHVKFGTGLSFIANDAFHGCSSLTELVFPSNITSIGGGSFSGCKSLKHLEIGSNLTAISSFAFDLIDFDYVTVAAKTSPAIGDGTFSVSAGTPLYVPQGCVSNYQFVGRTQPWITAGFTIQEMTHITDVKVDWKEPASAPKMKIAAKAADPGESEDVVIQLNATFEPANASLPYIFWESTNPEMATVDANGKVVIRSNVVDPNLHRLPSNTECKIIAHTMYADAGLAVELTLDGFLITTDVITIGETGYKTLYYSDRNLTVPEGVSAWTFSNDGVELTATKSYESGDIIPAETGVVLYTETPGDYKFVSSKVASAEVANNCLDGTDEKQKVTVASGIPYILLNGSHGIGFYQAAEGGGKTFTNGEHKAYLVVPESMGAACIKLNFSDDNTSGIQCISMDQLNASINDDVMYNIMGQPVDRDYKGFVIKNGKKYLNK